MSKILSHSVTFDDVLLVPGHSDVLPQKALIDSALSKDIALAMPLCSAAMDTVTEAPLAIAMAQQGGIGIIHKNLSIIEQARQVKRVKKYENGVVSNPITAGPNTSIAQLKELTKKYHFSGVPVVDGEQLVGIVTGRDVRFVEDDTLCVDQVMTPKERLVTVKEGYDLEQVKRLLHEHRIEKILVVNDQFHLRGLITLRDIQKNIDKPYASKDHNGRLRVGAAIGIGDSGFERAQALVEAGVDALVIDTAHGHSQAVIDMTTRVKKAFKDTCVIAGNIATKEAAVALAKAGADAVKVGIGPGSICTTRMVAGVGVPQLSAIEAVASGLKRSKVKIIADGGVRYSGDIAKAIAAGADCVMIGSLFAGTQESPGDIELFQGRSYKSYRGMGSIAAMQKGSAERYFQSQNAQKFVPEGVEGRVPFKGPLEAVIEQLIGGLRAAMGYTGNATIADMHKNARFVQISSAGVQESHAHDVTITKEPPNYQHRNKG